jgi:hypothetical protein
MLRKLSLAVLGLTLAAPMVASAGAPADTQASATVTIAAVSDPLPAPSREAKAVASDESAASPKREVRGSRTSDPGLRFHNPYAFPVQAMPVNLPIVTPFGF